MSAPLPTPISEFLWATDKDPRITTKTVDLPFTVDDKGAHFVQLKHTFSFVWLYFRVRRPELSGDPWDQTLNYNPGDQVYFIASNGKGNFYNANQATNPQEDPEDYSQKWDMVKIPYFLRQYLIQGGFADWLTGDGQNDRYDREEAKANVALEFEADKLQRQGGQVRRIKWRTNTV
jgi:hypothetical protein